jgi:hypothetical protein
MLYRSAINHVSKFIIFAGYGEISALDRAFFGPLVHEHGTNCIIKAAPEASDDFTDDDTDWKRDWLRFSAKILGKIRAIDIVQANSDSHSCLDVICEEGVKVVDAMFGPYGIGGGVLEYGMEGHTFVRCHEEKSFEK